MWLITHLSQMVVWLFLLSFPFISFYFFYLILYYFISPAISCHVPLEDEMEQYLNVDQCEKKSEKESKKKEEDEVGIKYKSKKQPLKNWTIIYYLPWLIIFGSAPTLFIIPL